MFEANYIGFGYLSVEYTRLGHLISSKNILGRDNIDVGCGNIQQYVGYPH
jgi:hypothetical protein